MTTDIENEMIDPAEWQVRGQLRHGGFVYGRGEPLPALTVAEAQRYEAQGSLVRILPDGTAAPSPRDARVPADARAYLQAADPRVLRSIVENKPSVKTLQEMLALAKSGGRTFLLRDALEAMLHYAGVSHPHADPPSE